GLTGGALAEADRGPESAGPGGCPQDLLGIWSTELPAGRLFDVRLAIDELTADGGRARIELGGRRETVPVWRSGERLRFQPSSAPLAFDGRLDADGAVSGFLTAGSGLHHLRLVPGEAGQGGERGEAPIGRATWSLLGVPGATFPLDLYIGMEDGEVGGWFFFRDPRLPSLFGEGMHCDGLEVRVSEKNLGLDLEGRFDRENDTLELTVRGLGGAFPAPFRRLAEDPMDAATPRDPGREGYRERAPEPTSDGWSAAAPSSAGIDPAPIAALVDEVREGRLPYVHSVLVARGGRLVVEEYFYGYARDTLHDMRSASKSVAALLTGLAIESGHLPGADARVLDHFPTYRPIAAWDPRKAEITVEHLLTMSSGLDADDSRWQSAASEQRYQSQRAQPDWMRLALDAPMVADPGARLAYGSANPMLLGGVLESAVGEPLERFAKRALLGPLGIDSYRWALDPTGSIYLGGGMYLRPRDMLKLGQLVLAGGRWDGRRLLSESWIRAATASYGPLTNVRDRNEYGYLWWHHDYRVGDRSIHAIEARGNGGQYVFVVPELELVAAITSGNYRNRDLLHQPEEILERFILPAVR
ncbi:MAG: serine hydrolase, partial [Thermoanaerobaculia bacterium]|nr:serine hydrolase [Thermoanaerobaculia bacterium]